MKDLNDPLLVVTIMIKDEASSITETLSSFLSKTVNYFFVLDTGSTDDSIQIVKQFFEEKNVIGYIQQESFIDFSTSRNRTLELATQQFPTAKFFIMPDAEWNLHNPEKLLEFCESEKDSSTPLYLINTQMNSMEYTTARLFRSSSKVKFKGVVHESPEITTSIKCPEPIYFEVKSTHHGKEKSKRRWQQDLLLLADAHNQNKEDPRTAFYFAQTYECLGLLESAYKTYKHRSKLNGWDEENFITHFRLGTTAEQLMNNHENISWEDAMRHYLDAFSLRPHRIEPLVKIADHYWPDNIPTCHLFIKYAYDIPYPKDDILFIETTMYNYDRYEIMSRSAWYAKEYELGYQATKMALKIHPEMEHLHNNLELYKSKTNRKFENYAENEL